MSREQLDYEDLLQKYGNEYLQEMNPDDCLYSMDEMDELLNDSAYNAIQRAFYGYDYNPYREGSGSEREPFNPNRDYFGFNGYANLVSVDSRDYVSWMDARIDEDGFIEWCIEQGYIDEEDEEEIQGVGATHGVLVGKILSVEYRNTSYYGNNSYWVYMDTDKGFVKAYTAANASLGYTIQSMEGKTVGFNYTKRKDGGIVLHQVADGWDYYGNRK